MKYLLIATSLVITIAIVVASRPVLAGPFDQVCRDTPQASVCQDSRSESNKNGSGGNSVYGPGSILAKATSFVALVVGVVSVIMIIIGAIKFALSGGDSSGVTSARNTVLYAVVGLIIAAAAQSIVVFVINKL